MIKIVVFAPHSDDETLGAGGYILKHKDLGDEVYWINVTNAKEEYGYTNEEVNGWNNAIEKVNKMFGFTKMYDLGLEPSGLDKMDKRQLIALFRHCIDEIKPNIVLIPFGEDTHSDHRIVFDCVMSCCKSFRCPTVEKILCMEIISESDYAVSDKGFVPNFYVDISNYIDKKIEIAKTYNSEILESPFPRNCESIKGLAKFRGASCYAHYAEGFRIMKEVER